MNKTSKIFTQFLKDNFGVQKNTPIFSAKSAAFLKTIYKDILKAERTWIVTGKESIHRHQPHLGHIHGNQFNEHNQYHDPDYSYIPQEIRHMIEHDDHWVNQYQFSLHGRTYIISMIHPMSVQDTETQIRRFFEDVLHKIYLWLSVASQFAPNHCSQQMHIHLFFTNHIKTIASASMVPLDWIHSNSAFTTGCANSTKIHIFRKEEWFKVFIHETFHNLGLDFLSMDNRFADRSILQLFHISVKEVRLYETYCEMWAELIHLLLFVFFTTNDCVLGNFSRILQKMERLLHYEILFSRFQCAKILNHYQITYQQLTDPSSKRILESRYKENTYILAYYIIKSVLLSEPNQFINWCLDHNGRTLEFRKTQENVQDFGQLVKLSYKTPIFLEKMQKMEEWFSDTTNGSLHDQLRNPLRSTLRMTLFEL